MSYRLLEAIQTHGPALTELSHEKFDDGIVPEIMSGWTSTGTRIRPGSASCSSWGGKFLGYG